MGLDIDTGREGPLRPIVDVRSRFTTGFSSEIGNKLRDWAVVQAGGSGYSWAALSSNDSKTL